jgi:hypothetical protein
MSFLQSADYTHRTDIDHLEFREWMRSLYSSPRSKDRPPGPDYAAFGSPEYQTILSSIDSEEQVFNRLEATLRTAYDELVKCRNNITRC